MPGSQTQEAVPPQKSRLFIYAATPGCFTQTDAFD
jgi:hypothetical protein